MSQVGSCALFQEGTPQAAERASDAPARRAPPSREATSRALLITGFIRPFTEKQARQMLSETGASKLPGLGCDLLLGPLATARVGCLAAQ